MVKKIKLYDTLCFCRSRLTLPVRLAVYNGTAPIAEAVGDATKRALYVPLIVASASPTEGGGVGTGLHINTARSRIGARRCGSHCCVVVVSVDPAWFLAVELCLIRAREKQETTATVSLQAE